MHLSCYIRTRWFFETYDKYISKISDGKQIRILDIGGVDWNGEFEFLNTRKYKKDVLDMEEHKGVTIIPKNIYQWDEISDDTYDIVMSANAFTFINYFWLTIQEMKRVVKPGGLVYIITPSVLWGKGYPRSNWGFNKDGLVTMAEWAQLEVLDASVGGVPEKTSGYEWDSPADDACLIAVKGKDIRRSLPSKRLKYERRWKGNHKKLPLKHYIRRRLEGVFHHYNGYRG